MKKRNIVDQRTAVVALYGGFILKNEHGYTVRLKDGRQEMSNPRRKSRSYQFDYPTWIIIGRISLWERFKNSLALFLW